VSGRWFLTAAHCVSDPSDNSVLPASAFTVRLGSANRNLGSEFGAEDVIRHDLYSQSTRSNDVALLRLDAAPPLGDTIAPLRLVAANESALWAPGTLASINGWGTTCFEQCATTTNLKEAGVPIVSDASCSSAYGGSFVATTMVCAGDGTADTCQGDSGGPIMVPRGDVYVLVGVTSTGVGCANPDLPGDLRAPWRAGAQRGGARPDPDREDRLPGIDAVAGRRRRRRSERHRHARLARSSRSGLRMEHQRSRR